MNVYVISKHIEQECMRVRVCVCVRSRVTNDQWWFKVVQGGVLFADVYTKRTRSAPPPRRFCVPLGCRTCMHAAAFIVLNQIMCASQQQNHAVASATTTAKTVSMTIPLFYKFLEWQCFSKKNVYTFYEQIHTRTRLLYRGAQGCIKNENDLFRRLIQNICAIQFYILNMLWSRKLYMFKVKYPKPKHVNVYMNFKMKINNKTKLHLRPYSPIRIRTVMRWNR